MGQRNMLCPIDLEMDQQGQGYLHPEPCIFLSSETNYPSPDIQMAITAPGSPTNLHRHPLSDHYDNCLFYAFPQQPGVQHHHHSPNLDLGIGSSSNFSHSPLDLRNPNFHNPAPSIEGARGHNINVHPQVPAVPYCFPASYASQSTMNPSQVGLAVGRRHFRPVPPTGFRIYHPRRESGALPETSLRHRNLPHLRVLPPDGVAVLEFPEFYEEVGNLIDHHRDMRLDIEDMSYEELLALGERIGKVNTGLSDETIRYKLKTRSYSTFAMNINLEEVASVDQEPEFCTICQEDYKNQEKIGTLDCGHEYHASCLRKWLLVKNVCPICKSEALAT